MNQMTINSRPTTTGPILDPKLIGAAPADILKAIIASALDVAEQNVKECYSGVRQFDPLTYQHIASNYPDGEAWRSCASPALSHLVDALRAITKDIPEAQRDLTHALDGQIIPKERTDALTDESILATDHKQRTIGEGTAP